MNNIWVIEEGSYSDYHVSGVFSSKANADRMQKIIGGDVSEWLLDPGMENLHNGLHLWAILMHRDGTVELVTRKRRDYCNFVRTESLLSVWDAYLSQHSRDWARMSARQGTCWRR